MKRKRRTKKKNKLAIIGLILLVLIIMTVAIYIFIFNEDILEYKTKITIEVGEEIPTIEDFLYDDENIEDEILWDDIEEVDGKIYRVGTYTGKFNYKKEEKGVTLIVKDTVGPVIEGFKDIEMKAYEEVPNLLEGITVIDNSGEEIELTLEGEYDTEKVGEYELFYVTIDSSGNETRQKFKLIVKENENIKISKTSKGNILKNYYGITYIDGVIVVNKTYNLPSNFAPGNLASINGYIKVVDYVKDAFVELTSDSASLGLNIYASSGYRSYGDQKYIYNNYVKWDGQTNADTYSARAGHSEHQTGLAIDVNTVDSSFDNTSESIWLKDNCYKYGFIIRYPKGKDDITGYMYEPWHIRYVGKELASKLYNNGDWITLEEYFGIDSKYK